MVVRNESEMSTFSSGTGENVKELLGAAVGGTDNHSLARITIEPGSKSALHYHPIAEESYIILEGRGHILMYPVEGEGEKISREVGPGDIIGIKKQIWHEIRNVSENANLVFYAICAPSWTPDCSVFAKEE